MEKKEGLWEWQLYRNCVHWGCRLTQSTDDLSFHPWLKKSLVDGCRSKDKSSYYEGRHWGDIMPIGRPTRPGTWLCAQCESIPGAGDLSALNLPRIRVVTRRLMVPPRISARPDPINTEHTGAIDLLIVRFHDCRDRSMVTACRARCLCNDKWVS